MEVHFQTGDILINCILAKDHLISAFFYQIYPLLILSAVPPNTGDTSDNFFLLDLLDLPSGSFLELLMNDIWEVSRKYFLMIFWALSKHLKGRSGPVSET